MELSASSSFESFRYWLFVSLVLALYNLFESLYLLILENQWVVVAYIYKIEMPK